MTPYTCTLLGFRHRYHVVQPDRPALPPVVALHGFGTSGDRTFRFIEQPLREAGVPFFALDLLGFGGSDRPDDGHSLRRYADLTAAFIDHLWLDRPPLLLGHSLGGKIGVATGVLHPASLSALVLVNPGGFSRYAPLMPLLTGQRWLHGLLDHPFVTRHVLPRTPLSGVLPTPESRRQLRRFDDAHAALDLRRSGILRGAAELSMPHLLLWGEDDPILPPSTLPRIQCALPGIEVQRLPTAGHAPMRDCPRAFTARLTCFLRSMA